MQRSAIETFLRNLHTTVALQPSSPDELASLPALDRLTSFIEEHEKLKYPASAFMYSTKKNTFNNEDLIVTHIIKNADDSYPTEEQLKEISQESLKIRKLSLIAGIVNMLNQSSNFLNINDAGEKNRLIDNLMVLATNIHEKTNKDIKLSLEANMEKFINSLISTVMETSKLDKENVLRQIRNTERYYVAMKNRRRAIVCEYYDKNINAIIQTDIPFNNKLSVEQKNEFMEIYHKPPLEIPAWFTALPKWEQDWLKRHIPKNINDSWDEFESIFQSSAMQHIPGVKNGRFNYLVKKNINNDEYDILSSSSKTASLVPYEMPNSTKATEQNAEHLHGILLEKAKDNFKDKWGNILLSPPPVLILFQSLLSNTLFGATDKVLHNLQKEAINKLRARNTKATVIFGNLAVNILRHLPGEETSYITQIIRIADEFLNSLSQSTKPLDFKQIKRLRLIKCALKNLREMEASMPSGLLRNDAAFKAAYVGILVEEMGVLAGIKVDKGLVVLPNTKEEPTTQGLDDLAKRLADYKAKGASFAKWRATYNISATTPSYLAIQANAESLARYAAICQEAGIVPIVEPEVLIDGDHTIERCEEVSEPVFQALFEALHRHKVKLEYIVLKPSMVISGKSCAQKANVMQVAEATLRVLRRTVPAAVPTINFLSGGQSSEQATAHLNAMNQIGNLPWNLSFSYARALQDYAMKTWKGQANNVAAAQKAFHKRAKLNSMASQGKYAEKMENDEACAA